MINNQVPVLKFLHAPLLTLCISAGARGYPPLERVLRSGALLQTSLKFCLQKSVFRTEADERLMACGGGPWGTLGVLLAPAPVRGCLSEELLLGVGPFLNPSKWPQPGKEAFLYPAKMELLRVAAALAPSGGVRLSVVPFSDPSEEGVLPVAVPLRPRGSPLGAHSPSFLPVLKTFFTESGLSDPTESLHPCG